MTDPHELEVARLKGLLVRAGNALSDFLVMLESESDAKPVSDLADTAEMVMAMIENETE